MRVAIIDLGTNSVRFDVHQIGPKGQVRQLHREKLMVRLGQGVFLEGKLDREAIRRTLHAFQSFQQTAVKLKADKIIAFGTSALREASDSDRLLNRIQDRTRIDVRVISGTEEARLIAIGILAHEKLPKGRFGLIDIGGGSTEISICQARRIGESYSFQLGTARLQQVFLKSSPPRADSVHQLRKYIRNIVTSHLREENWPKVEKMIGSSGTIRALAKIVRKTGGGKTIDRSELKKIVKTMSTMTTTQLLGLPGMESKRVDMILAGAVLLEECMEAVGAKKVFTTEFSLRDGILQEQVQALKSQRKSPIAFHLPDLRQKAIELTGDTAHLDQNVALADSLFTKLQRLHRLEAEWKTYLIAAALMHETGEIVSPAHYEVHSYYIVKNADFPMMEKWESEFIAQLCLRHRVGKVNPEETAFAEDKLKKQAFIKLLSLLRIADALVQKNQKAAKIKSVKITTKHVKIALFARTVSELELLRVEQKKDLFETAFQKKLIVFRQ